MDATKDGGYKQSSEPKNHVIRIFEFDATIKCWNSELSRCGDFSPAYQLYNWAEDSTQDPKLSEFVSIADINVILWP